MHSNDWMMLTICFLALRIVLRGWIKRRKRRSGDGQ